MASHCTGVVWMLQMLAREMRMVDAQIVAALQNGTAFFASTSLIAIGGALTLMRSTETILDVVAALPFGIKTTSVQWEAKTMGLAIIFVYAFFKFAWSYRLYNYVAIMVGAAPPKRDRNTRHAKHFAHRTARRESEMNCRDHMTITAAAVVIINSHGLMNQPR